MGNDYRLEEFGTAGDAPRVKKFNIALNECQGGIKKVTYSLHATSQVLDKEKGLVALSSESTAKGIGLKLMNDIGQPIALDTSYTFNEFDPTGKNFQIPLSAAYYRLADTQLEAGSANVSVTFTINYL
ncbi:fimbrial protein [Pseudomonas sp. SK3(2021)]|nr:fimbrial protein [Pseudomonas sp. SK3(2021)]